MPEANGTTVEQIIAAKIVQLRGAKALKQEDLAAAVNLRGLAWTRSTVALIETDRRAVSAVELLVLASIFNVSLTTFFDNLSDDRGTILIDDGRWPVWYFRAVVDGTAGQIPAPAIPPLTEADEHVRTAVDAANEWGLTSLSDFTERWGIRDLNSGQIHQLFLTAGGIEGGAALRIRRRTRRRSIAANDVAAAVVIRWAEWLPPKIIMGGIEVREFIPWTLANERDRRVTEAVGESLDPRRLQALRGHAMRQLDRELEIVILKVLDRPAKAKRQKGTK